MKVRQYLLKKEKAERTIYMNSTGLYGELHAQRQTLLFYLDNSSASIPENTLERRLGLIDHHHMCIQAFEYNTFCHKSKFRQKLNDCKNTAMPHLIPHLASCLRLPEAIVRTKLDLCGGAAKTQGK